MTGLMEPYDVMFNLILDEILDEDIPAIFVQREGDNQFFVSPWSIRGN